MMCVPKPVLCWIFILWCWRGTEAKAKISMENRIRVALTGQTLTFNMSLNVPENSTYKSLDCYHQNKQIKWDEEKILESGAMLVTELKMHNVSFSGNYNCRYEGQEVHWVILVRDKGYVEPIVAMGGITIQMCVSGILLIFSVAGSLYILKSCRKQPPIRESDGVTEQRPEDAEDAAMDEDVASASVYTALQHRASPIYDMLNTENKQEKKSKQKKCRPQEDDKHDSVYENL